MHHPGLVTLTSNLPFDQTLSLLEVALHERGLALFARIDHASAAAGVGMALGPTMLVLFGDPKTGTPLMQTSQTVGIDLPLKILIWEDNSGEAFLSYNNPRWIAERHGLGAYGPPEIDRIEATLAALAEAATGSTAPR